jgi:hypothetical protein
MLTFPGYVVRHPRDVAAELPADLQPLLDGKQHTYNPIIGTAHWLPAREGPQPGVPYATTLDLTGWDCFELTAEELSTLPNRGAFGDGRPPYGSLQAMAIHPHGQPVVWAG